MNNTIEKRIRRHRRVRAKIVGTSERPRLAVWKSNTTLYAQLIDDSQSHTLCAATSKDTSVSGKTPQEKAFSLGKVMAAKALEKKITKIVFDRGGFRYTGNIKAIAEGSREGGLIF